MPPPPSVYRTLSPSERSTTVAGQIFWIPAYSHMEHHYVVRVRDDWNKVTLPIPIDIKQRSIRQIGSTSDDLFNHMPYPELKVSRKEELLTKIVKKRPAILLDTQGYNTRRLAEAVVRPGLNPQPRSGVFAPIISLRKEDNISQSYPEGFVEKVKEGEFPAFIHLPVHTNVIVNESMAVFTELQWHERKLVEPTNVCVEADYLAGALQSYWIDLDQRMCST